GRGPPEGREGSAKRAGRAARRRPAPPAFCSPQGLADAAFKENSDFSIITLDMAQPSIYNSSECLGIWSIPGGKRPGIGSPPGRLFFSGTNRRGRRRIRRDTENTTAMVRKV